MVSTLAVVIGLTAVTAYLASTLMLGASFLKSTEVRTATFIGLSSAGILLHGVANYLVIYAGDALHLGIHTSASLVSWIMLVFVLITNLRLNLQNLFIVVLPIGMLGLLALITTPEPAADSGSLAIASLDDPLIWHILISIVAYSILFMAACQSILLAVLEHRLKARQTFRLLRLLPPLQTMEALLFNLLWTGIIALTLAIGSGFIFLDDMFEQRVVHHTILSLASWLLYAILLTGRHLFGWRGTTAVRWTLIAFSLLVLGYFGSKFVIEVLLER